MKENSQVSSQSANFWSLPATELFRLLDSNPTGLSSAQASERLQQFGPNLLQVREQVTPIKLFLGQFKSPIILILLFATIVSAFLGDWADALIILFIVLGSAILSFVQENSASQAAEELRSKLTSMSSVMRDGQISSIATEKIVPGDLVVLSAGSLIPADGVILESKDFFVNESVLTGETFPVEKRPGEVKAEAGLAERLNVVYMGTNARSGNARALIITTGRGTAFGQIAHRLSLRPPETEFERGIKNLGYLLTEVMLVLVLVIFALNVYFHKPVIDSLLFSIALAVGLTPQLLPAIININLSKGSREMARNGVIVRRLESIENFGSMDILCTDKTGTITEGVIQVEAAVDTGGKPSEDALRLAYLNASLQTGLPNPLDQAILEKKLTGLEDYKKVDEIPYDFVRKRLSVVVRDGQNDLLITKGAFENVLAVSDHLQKDGKILPLDRPERERLEGLYQSWSQQGYRVLGIGWRKIETAKTGYQREDENHLTLGGFLLFLDQLKPGIADVIQGLRQLEVELKIITGDNRFVSRHMAEQIGLDPEALISGEELENLRDEALWKVAERTSIFAEVDPNQKERIILALKKTGHIVGYMGDGINDAPSLHAAEVGISVNNAVDVAKEAADFVLMEQDLAVLRQGILEGRKTLANTLKYVFMATSANFGNMFSMAGASIILPFLPMLPKQILLVNFMTDLPEMMIAGDRVDDSAVERPRRWEIGFLRRFMLVFGSLSSVFDFLTFGFLLWFIRADQTLFHTGWFVESVVSACAIVFVLRTQSPFYRSRPGRGLLYGSFLVILAAVALPYTPLAGPFGFEPLPVPYLLALGAIVLLYFLAAEATKRWFFHRFPG
jgi:P-type Mg2+ transporter